MVNSNLYKPLPNLSQVNVTIQNLSISQEPTDEVVAVNMCCSYHFLCFRLHE